MSVCAGLSEVICFPGRRLRFSCCKIPCIFNFFFNFGANSATHLSAKTVSESVNCMTGFCDVEPCPPRLGPGLCSPFHISHHPAHTWQKTEDSISHACMTPGFGPFFSKPPSSHGINLALLSLVFAVTTQSLGCPCQLSLGVCQGCVSGKMNSVPWRGGGAVLHEANHCCPFSAHMFAAGGVQVLMKSL